MKSHEVPLRDRGDAWRTAVTAAAQLTAAQIVEFQLAHDPMPRPADQFEWWFSYLYNGPD